MLLVIYDISDDRRRTRLHDDLWEVGRAVQYSAFECPDESLPRVLQLLEAHVGKTDRASVYRVCRRCFAKAIRLGEIEDAPAGGPGALSCVGEE